MAVKSRVKVGGQVLVIAGNDKGKNGKVLHMKGERITIEGVNVRKKHMKPTQQNQKGQIIDLERPIHISNVKAFAEDQGVKLRARFNKAGEKELFYTNGKKDVVFRSMKKSKK